MIPKSLSSLAHLDLAIAEAIHQEMLRQEHHIELIASENFVSPAVLAAQGSALTNKYAEGYPGRRYYGGCAYVDRVETLAQDRLKSLFNCRFANVQPHSGSQANQAVFLALLKPGDTLLGMSLDAGGHLTHGSPVNLSGKWFHAVSYGVHPDTGRIDYEALEEQARQTRPALIIAGGSAYPRTIDFARFRAIAEEVGAYLLVDMAHIAGLVAAGLHPSPFPHAHVVTSTTHKTLRGPRGGIILTEDPALAKKINSAVFPGIQGGPLMHVIAAKAVAFGEASHPSFKKYMQNVVLNSQALGETLRQSGYDLVTGGTDTHLLLVDLRKAGLTGKEAQETLEQAYITCNKNGVPGDTRSPQETSGIRLGSAAMTTRGLGIKEFQHIGQWMVTLLRMMQYEDRASWSIKTQEIQAQAQALGAQFPVYANK